MVINLFVLDKIFTEQAQTKLSGPARALYVNCLTQHFKDKPASVMGAMAFEMFTSDFGDFEKYRKTMQELHKAGLVVIGDHKVSFVNCWGKYIDRTKLEKAKPEEYIAGFRFEPASKFKDELFKSEDLYELCGMKYKLLKPQVEKLIHLFVKEQDTFEKTYNGLGECKRHFIFWAGTNKDKVPASKPKGKILGNE